MGVGGGLYMHDVVVKKSSRSLSHLLMSSCYQIKILVPVSLLLRVNKSSAVGEMGDRLATIDMARKVGVLCPFPW